MDNPVPRVCDDGCERVAVVVVICCPCQCHHCQDRRVPIVVDYHRAIVVCPAAVRVQVVQVPLLTLVDHLGVERALDPPRMDLLMLLTLWGLVT